MKAPFLLLKARFLKVKQDLKTPQHAIADGAAVSQIDQSAPLQSDQFALERIYLVQIPCFGDHLGGFVGWIKPFRSVPVAVLKMPDRTSVSFVFDCGGRQKLKRYDGDRFSRPLFLGTFHTVRWKI